VANINVTYDEMRDAGSRLRNGQSEIEGKLGELKSMIDGLVNGGYVTDRSSKAFDQSYTEFNDGIRKAMEGLDGMAQYLEQAAQALQETDEALANALKG
jgi:WXG100 family type VII secretion target